MSSFFNEKELIPYVTMCEYAPMPMAIFEAKKLRLISVNDKMLHLWDRTPTILGETLLNFMPELANQRFPDLLNEVAATGNPVQEHDAVVMLQRAGQLQQVQMDFSYVPLYSKANHAPTGILVYAMESISQQLYQKSIDTQDYNLRTMVLSSPVPMCVFSGENLDIKVVNEQMMDIWKCTESRNLDLLKAVFYTGVMMKKIENGIEFSCTARRAPQGDIIGCILIASPVGNTTS